MHDQPQRQIFCGDMLEVLPQFPDGHFDLCFTSPPYENARTYGINFKAKDEAFVEWCKPRFMECLRVTNGLVCWVVNNKTRQFRSSCVVECLIADLHRNGVNFRKSQVFHRVGIPGSGGPDYMRDDWEFVIVAQRNKGKLKWSNNTACGHPPKWAPGGEMSNRISSGARVNQWGHPIASGGTVVDKDGNATCGPPRPSHRDQWGDTGHASSGEGRKANGEYKTRLTKAEKVEMGAKLHTKNDAEGMREQAYLPPVLANPGNVTQQTYTAEEVKALLHEDSNVIKCNVGGGLMGSPLAHDNEAPFPESLVERFVLPFCKPGGTVIDPFCGSGTVGAVAVRHERKFVGIDIRESQCDLTLRRLDGVQKVLC